ncbi:MAG TPA: hypothetical protein VGV92_08120 [Gammaproteobacteria bacterium]|nr:hypothetical protein [Gammaproteobacteria bacterium]
MYFKLYVHGLLEEFKKDPRHSDKRLEEVNALQQKLFTIPSELLYQKIYDELSRVLNNFLSLSEIEKLAIRTGLKKRKVSELISSYLTDKKITDSFLLQLVGELQLTKEESLDPHMCSPSEYFIVCALQQCENAIAPGGDRKKIEGLEQNLLAALPTSISVTKLHEMVFHADLGEGFNRKVGVITSATPSDAESSDSSKASSARSSSRSSESSARSPSPTVDEFAVQTKSPKRKKPSRRKIEILTPDEERKKSEAAAAEVEAARVADVRRIDDLIKKRELEQRKEGFVQRRENTQREISRKIEEMAGGVSQIRRLEEKKEKFEPQIHEMKDRLQQLEVVLSKATKNSEVVMSLASYAHVSKANYEQAYKNGIELAKKGRNSGVKTAQIEDIVSRCIEASVECHRDMPKIEDEIKGIEGEIAQLKAKAPVLEQSIVFLRGDKAAIDASLAAVNAELAKVDERLSQAATPTIKPGSRMM